MSEKINNSVEILEINKDRNIVAKHNDLVGAKHKLSVQENRIIAIMISDIKPEDEDFKLYRYKISDFVKWIGVKGKNYYNEFRNITQKLLERVITIKKENTILQINWISSAEYYEKKGIVELRFDPKLKPYLLRLKKYFTQYALICFLQLRSFYAQRIYELLKQYQSVGKRKFHINELKEKLGIEENKYKKWSDFKRYVLDIAKKEINKKTDIKIDYKVEKIARKIEYIFFTIKTNTNNIPENSLDFEESYRYDDLLKLIPVKYRKLKTIKNAIIKYLKKKGFDYVKRNIEYSNENANKNYRVFLLKSLAGDWGKDWEEDKEILEKYTYKKKSDVKKETKIIKRKEEEIKKMEKHKTIWNKLNNKQKEKYIKKILEEYPQFKNFMETFNGVGEKMIISYAMELAYEDYKKK